MPDFPDLSSCQVWCCSRRQPSAKKAIFGFFWYQRRQLALSGFPSVCEQACLLHKAECFAAIHIGGAALPAMRSFVGFTRVIDGLVCYLADVKKAATRRTEWILYQRMSFVPQYLHKHLRISWIVSSMVWQWHCLHVQTCLWCRDFSAVFVRQLVIICFRSHNPAVS